MNLHTHCALFVEIASANQIEEGRSRPCVLFTDLKLANLQRCSKKTKYNSILQVQTEKIDIWISVCSVHIGKEVLGK